MRDGIKARVGKGWTVGEQSGKVKLTFRPAGQDTRQAYVLPFTWESSNARKVEDVIAKIRDAMKEQKSIALTEIADSVLGGGTDDDGLGDPTTIDWDSLFATFRDWKLDAVGQCKPGTFDHGYLPVFEILKSCASKKPLVRDAKALLKRMVAACPTRRAGTASRKQLVSATCQVLTYAVEELNFSPVWMPPTDRSDFIGERMHPKRSAPPIPDDGLLRLLDSIEETHPQWWLAIAACAAFGLRPVEIKYCRVSDCGNKLNVFYFKRNAKTKAENFKPSDVPPVPPVARPDLGRRVLQALKDGRTFPPTGSGNQVAGRFQQFLKNRKEWHFMQAEQERQGRDQLTAYGLRHGFAYRCHRDYKLPVRFAAAIMRHDVNTHNKDYGKWADAESIDSLLAEATARLQPSITIESEKEVAIV